MVCAANRSQTGSIPVTATDATAFPLSRTTHNQRVMISMTTFTVHMDLGRHVVRDVTLPDHYGRTREDAARHAANAYGALSYTIGDDCPACVAALTFGHTCGRR